MTEARKLVMQSAFLRKVASMESSRSGGGGVAGAGGYDGGDADAETDSEGYGYGYGNGYRSGYGDGDDSGYTEIPMMDEGDRCVGNGSSSGGGSGGLRDRVARLVFRTRPQQQQPPLPPLHHPQPPGSAPQSRRRRPQQAEFSGHSYTRWGFLQPCQQQAAGAMVELTAGRSSPKTVRFRCPYETEAVSVFAGASDTSLVQPYSTSAFAVCSQLPPPPPQGERSASSGYGSDMDAASASASPGISGSSGDHWAVREEDIDKLFFGTRNHVPLSAPQPLLPLAPPSESNADLDVNSLDLAAFFPPTRKPSLLTEATAAAAVSEQSQIDRIVGEALQQRVVVALVGRSPESSGRSSSSSGSSMGGGGCVGSPWRQQHQRRRLDGIPAPSSSSAACGDSFELADLRPTAAAAHSSRHFASRY